MDDLMLDLVVVPEWAPVQALDRVAKQVDLEQPLVAELVLDLVVVLQRA